MMTMAEKNVRDQLDRVFTQNGEVKACGRAECRKAIQAASEFYPGVNFGNIETGIMDLQAFQDYFFSDKALRKQLLEVFTTQGVLLPIKREECSKLIRMAQYFYPKQDFGKEELGCVKLDAFHQVFFYYIG